MSDKWYLKVYKSKIMREIEESFPEFTGGVHKGLSKDL